MVDENSVFKTMAQDITAKIGDSRDLDLNPLVRTGRVLAYDDFEEGFGGWADHYSGTPSNPNSLISDRALQGQRSLLLAGRSKARQEGQFADWGHRSAATWNRMSRDFSERYVDISWFMAVGGTDAFAIGSFGVHIDTQTWDSTQRSYFRMIAERNSATGDVSRWTVQNGSEAVPISGTGPATPAFPGYNESKMNGMYARLTIDMQANGNLGGYVQAQLGGRLFDLTTIGAVPEQQTPQYVAGDQNQSFGGGFNVGLAMAANVPDVNNTIPGEAWAVLDQIAISVRNTV